MRQPSGYERFDVVLQSVKQHLPFGLVQFRQLFQIILLQQCRNALMRGDFGLSTCNKPSSFTEVHARTKTFVIMYGAVSYNASTQSTTKVQQV